MPVDDDALDALCDAGELAGMGNVSGAEAAFVDRAHAYIHTLAAEVQRLRPADAAELLEAKHRVEAGLEDRSKVSVLPQLFDRLRAAATVAVGGKAVPCP